MSQQSDTRFYVPPDDFLQQGDIFSLELVTPIADATKRLFRTTDGRHGSFAFEPGNVGHVFSPKELERILQKYPRSPHHTAPFQNTDDDQPEMVVVHANLIYYFVIATQTCDLSSKKVPQAIILPMRTLPGICKSMEVSFLNEEQKEEQNTIDGYLRQLSGFEELCECNDDLEYGSKLRELINYWRSSQEINNTLRKNLNRIRDFLNKFYDSAILYPLRSDKNFGVPECCVDFSAVYTVLTQHIEKIKSYRIARIGNPYRDQFAGAFANHISRIATPGSITPEKF